MFIIEQLLRGAVLPGLVTVIVLVLAWQPWRCAICPFVPRIAPLAVGLGFFAGYCALLGLPRFPALEAEGWLPWLALALGALGLLPLPSNALLRWLPAALLSAALVWLTLKPRIQPGVEGFWDQSSGLLYIAVITAVVLRCWVMLAAVAKRIEGPAIPAAYVAAATAASFALLMTHSGKLAQFAGLLAACCGAAAFIAVFQPQLASLPYFTGSFWLIYCGLLLGGHFYSGLELLPALLLAIAPLALWLVAGPAVKRGRWAAMALCAGCVLVPALAALGLIRWEETRSTEPASESGEIDYENYYR